MKAIIWTAYGEADVLQLQDIEKPIPADNELLIRIYATTVTAGDCETRNLQFPFLLALPMRLYTGFNKPKRIKILGQEFAGQVEAVGKDVKRFKPGDAVFGATTLGLGTYTEYLTLAEDVEDIALAAKPSNMSYEEAAAVPTGGLESLHFLRQANIQPGQKLLINGAGGSIGTAGVQLAKYYGAEVTAVDSTSKLDMLRSIGSDHVIDYTQEDFAKRNEQYDVIFDVVGKESFSRCIQSLKPTGYYLLANPRLSSMFRGMWISATSGKTIKLNVASHKSEDLLFLKELIEAGKLKTYIDRRYPLEEIVEAHRYVETGRKVGNVVITITEVMV